ncbi:MAG TPA: radical SAM protein [Terriglobia bacterium]|jgi:MoaA/NifB/PqqE/SkfB family radical SAM enzyme|nr:radical SAM protein [Terriglobia bacterium]
MARLTRISSLHEMFARPRRLKTVIFFVTSACNARCRTCFYWQELNQRGDLTWEEIQKLARTMPRFTDLWLSGGEPMLRRDLAGIIHLFYETNGIRWVNLPTNGLFPQRTAAWVDEILAENAELELDVNVALDGLGAMQDSIRAVPGNFKKTLETLEALQPARGRHPRLRLNVNTVICAENFDHVIAIAEFVKANCEVDGHYFNVIRGEAKDPGLKAVPAARLPELYARLQAYYGYYASNRSNRGLGGVLARAYYQGTLAFHNRVQLENASAPHRWPMPCTAGETAVVIDYNGDLRACELRGKLGNLRDFECDFGRFWETQGRKLELDSIVRDQCWCTHVCFIHDSLRHSAKALLYDIPLAYLGAKLKPQPAAANLAVAGSGAESGAVKP